MISIKKAQGLLLLSALFVFSFVLAWVPSRRVSLNSTQSQAFRVGLVFDVGGRGDKSFNDAAYAGLLRAHRELGVAIEFVEPSGAEDREAALRLFAARGFQLVLGVGFIFSRDIDAVARDYINIRFACVDYAPAFGPQGPMPIPPNVTGLSFREHEGSFLAGAAAALASKTQKVGFVGGMEMPLIRKFEVGYQAGVRRVCPKCIVLSAYAGGTPDAFRDPAKGKAIALSQIGRGVDVIFHASGSTGHGIFEAARESGALAIGVDSDQYEEAPGHVLTSMVKQADVSVFDAIAAAKTSTLEGGMRMLGLKEGGIDIIHSGPHAALLTELMKAKLNELRAKIIAQEIVVPSR